MPNGRANMVIGCTALLINGAVLRAQDASSAGSNAAPTGSPAVAAVSVDHAIKPTPSKLSPAAAARQMSAMRRRDPIGFMAMDLVDLTRLLDVFNTRDPLQPRQQEFVGRLDELIAMLEKQARSGSGGAGGRPMNDSVIAKGPGGQGPMHDAKSGTRNWGQLPPKQREQILQSQNEGFPAGFESILSSYYKRLAQENVNADSATSPSTPGVEASAPSTQPESR